MRVFQLLLNKIVLKISTKNFLFTVGYPNLKFLTSSLQISIIQYYPISPPLALPYRHLVANFWNGIGYWLLNKLIKQTFNWRKKHFFLELYHRFHEKFVIKSLIFKIFFSGWIAFCLHFTFIFTAHRHRVAVSVLIIFVVTTYNPWFWLIYTVDSIKKN